MGIGAITLDAAGAVTQPTAYPLALTTPVGVAINEYPLTFARNPRLRSLVYFNGFAPLLQFVTNVGTGSVTAYRLGGLAPYAALTVGPTGSGARSTATFTPGGHPADQTYIVIVSAGDQTNHEWRVYFVTNFITTGGSALLDYWQVKRGASEAIALDNLKSAINGTGTDGNEYRSPTNGVGVQTVHHPRAWSDWVTAETNTDTTQAFRAVAYGTGGNVYEASAGTAGGTFGTSSLFTGGTAMTGTAPQRGNRQYAYAYRRTPDEMTTGLSPAVSYEQLDDGNAALSVIADPDTTQNESIDAKVWMRTLDGGDVFHEGYDIVVADTTDTDDLEDSDGTTPIEDNPEADPFRRTYADGFPPRYAIVSEKDGRLFGARYLSAKDYTVGTADVEFGRIYVTLSSATHPRNMMEHRKFIVTTSATTQAQVYEIVYVAQGTKRLYLDRPYEGTTSGTAAYVVRDDRDSSEIGYSEPGDFHTWPPDNVLEGIHSPNPEGVTAIVNGEVYFTRTGIWTLRGDTPDTYSFVHEYEGVGCVGQNAWCVAEGRIWFVGDDGLYVWAGQGSGEPFKLSSPPVKRGGPTGVGGTVERINRTYAHLALAHFEPTRRIVRFFLPLDDETTNRYALVFDLQTRLWALDHYGIDVCYVTTLPDPSGGLHTIAGDLQGDPWELDIGNSDGAFGFEPKNAITSSTRLTVTCSGAVFPTTGDALKGVPVTFVDASGNFTYNTIASNTGTVLTLARIEATAPTGTAYVGAIHGIIETGRFAWGDPARSKVLAYARVAFSPDVDGQFFFSFTFNQGDATVGSDADGDLTATDNEEQFWIRQSGRMLRWRIDVLEPGCDPAFLGVLLDVPRREALAVS